MKPAKDPALSAWRIAQKLAQAALDGATEADLVIAFAAALAAEGVEVSVIEVACDAVDPEREDRFLHWRRDDGAVATNILARDVYRILQAENKPVLRPADATEAFAPVLTQPGADAIAFMNHLAPDISVGFFDDVLSLFVTDRSGGFTQAESEILRETTPIFALALGARVNAGAARVLLQTYLGQEAATAMLSGRIGLGDVAKVRAVVIYCDLVNFTAITERLDPQTLIDHLNIFFETITRPMTRAGGQISGHVGDAVVMYFAIPADAGERSVCANAVAAALAGLRDLDQMNARARDLAAPLRGRMGVDIGDVVHGNIGSTGRFSFTIIGPPVNRAARLQALAKELGVEALTTREVAEAAGVPARSLGRHALRGFEHPVDLVALE